MGLILVIFVARLAHDMHMHTFKIRFHNVNAIGNNTIISYKLCLNILPLYRHYSAGSCTNITFLLNLNCSCHFPKITWLFIHASCSVWLNVLIHIIGRDSRYLLQFSVRLQNVFSKIQFRPTDQNAGFTDYSLWQFSLFSCFTK